MLKLEQEIARLELALLAVEEKLNAFEALLRSHLQPEILRINALTAVYKTLKKAKKAKRLEQKKRGKNYREPQGLKPQLGKAATFPTLSADDQERLKRLYREAIVQVHPDKFALGQQDIVQKATDLTMKLNTLYQQEDLEELTQFHQHILSGNAMAHESLQPQTVKDPQAMLRYLKKRRQDLETSLQQTMQSPSFVVLNTYENPLKFIDEMREQFRQRILQLEKRTRKA